MKEWEKKQRNLSLAVIIVNTTALGLARCVQLLTDKVPSLKCVMQIK